MNVRGRCRRTVRAKNAEPAFAKSRLRSLAQPIQMCTQQQSTALPRLFVMLTAVSIVSSSVLAIGQTISEKSLEGNRVLRALGAFGIILGDAQEAR